MCQLEVDFFDVFLDAGNVLVRLVLVEFQDTCHLDFHQAEDVFLRYFTHEHRIERSQAFVDVFTSGIHVLGLFEFLILVDAFFDEDFFERGEVQAFEQFSPTDFKLFAEESEGIVCRLPEHIAYGEEMRLLLVDDTTVGRDAHLAIREGVERIQCLVRRYARGEMDEDFYLFGSQILYLANLDFPLFAGFHDGVAHRWDGLPEWNFGDGKRLVVYFIDFGTNLHHTTTFAVVVLRHVDGTTCLEVGIELELLLAQIGDGGIAKLVEVVRKNLGGQTDGNPFHSLSEEERKLDGKRDGFFVSSVVGSLPFGGLRIEHHIEGKFRETRFDVTRSSCPVAREDVPPVSLAIYQQILLSELHQGIADRSIAVGVELHGVPHDVRHLVVASVVQTLHGVEDASLNGLQSVVDVGDGTFQDNVGGIVQKPVLIHAGELVFHAFFLGVGGFIIRMLVFFFKVFVAHIYLISLMFS